MGGYGMAQHRCLFLTMRVPVKEWSGLGRLTAALVVLMGLASAQQPISVPPVARLSQAQAAGRFLRGVLLANYAAAYGYLAPEVRRAIGPSRFAMAARQLWKSAPPQHREIELYKLGLRLDDTGRSRLFYSFSFAVDSGLKTPPVLLEVTFRDTASRAVLGFGVRYSQGPPKSRTQPRGRKK